MTTQGIEARSGETGTGSTEGESPSGKAGAPKLDWTAPLMLDDGKGTGVEVIEGPDRDGDYRVRVHAKSRWYSTGGTPVYSRHLPRIINRPKPDAEPVEWGEGLTGEEIKFLNLPGDTPVRNFGLTKPARQWTFDALGAVYSLPANSPAYIVHAWNKAHPVEQPFRVHFGDERPVDPETRVDVLVSNGFPSDFNPRPARLWAWHRIIGYRIAQPVEQLPADEPDTVTVPRMTWEEWRALEEEEVGGPTCSIALNCALRLGLIRPDDPLDRFTASHPNWRDLDKEEAVRLALEQRGEG